MLSTFAESKLKFFFESNFNTFSAEHFHTDPAEGKFFRLNPFLILLYLLFYLDFLSKKRKKYFQIFETALQGNLFKK